MISNSSSIPYSVPVSPIGYSSGGCGNDGMWGDGSWWIIILFLFIFAGWNGNGSFGGNGSGAIDNYVLNSDFSTLSRQLDTATDGLRQQSVQISNGLCDGFYTQAQLVNGVNTNILTQSNALGTAMQQGFNGVGTQLANMAADQAQCCCTTQRAIDGVNYNNATNTANIQSSISDVNYNIATQANGVTTAIQSGLCQANFNNANNTRDIIDSQNAGTRAILEKLDAQAMEAKNAQINALTQQVNALSLAASQSAQNNYLIEQLKTPCPIPAYLVANNSNCGCNNGYYNGFYGSQILAN